MRSSYLYHGDPYAHKMESLYHWDSMMMISNGNIFRVTGLLCGEFTSHRWIPLTKASDAELWYFFYLRLNQQLSKQWKRKWFHSRASEHIKYEYHLCNKVAHLSCCVACAKLWPDCMITRNYSKKIFLQDFNYELINSLWNGFQVWDRAN